MEGAAEVVLTTNGMLLKRMAVSLRQSGVKRLNISLDSLRAETFASMTAGGNLSMVLAGIDAAQDAGFPPPQINVVVLRGVNDGEIPTFAAFAATSQLSVRFIEYMPITGDPGWRTLYVSSDEVLEMLARDHRLTPSGKHGWRRARTVFSAR